MKSYPEVNRVEVIDSSGRVYMEYNANTVQVSIQDDGKTLKVFLQNLNNSKRPPGAANYEEDKRNINWGNYKNER